ncbi:MAG TPA: hypothetical protein VN611_04040 [Patescibacteria group bacterium]|nr:hypothetical protein [Patescibacteria group bacterium]
MSVAAIGNTFSLSLPTQQTQQNTSSSQSTTSSSSSSVGVAATVELSGASASSGTTQASGAVQSSSGGSGSSSSSSQCVLGNPVCLNCGQCGKSTTQSQTGASTQSQSSIGGLMVTDTSQNYQMTNAINAYDKASIFA